MRAFTRISGAAVSGAQADLVDVQVSVACEQEGGERSFRIVGMPDSALREGRERIRSAVVHGGWPWPFHPVTVNLAPAAARKEGAALDLPIALAVLGAQGVLGTLPHLDAWLALGELTLDGALRPVRGVIAAAQAARRAGLERAIVPKGNAAEAAAVDGLAVHPVQDLREAVGHLTGRQVVARQPRADWSPEPWGAERTPPVRGQEMGLRAAWIAAAGGHNLLLTGPPGTGKTLLARHVADIMPPLDYAEALEASRVHSVAGLLESGLLRRRPFRAPHHTASLAGLVGGGTVPRPGEVSLAHLGVLFLDELAEFPRNHLEALRQPIEDGSLVLARAAGRVRFPAAVLLVAASNPCPCGWRGVPSRCKCSPRVAERYASRISGPLLDRFDLRVELSPVDPERLVGRADPPPFPAAAMQAARERQAVRARRLGCPRPFNARIPAGVLPAAVQPSKQALRRMTTAARNVDMTARGVHRCLRVARTIADLSGSEEVAEEHILHATTLRA